MLICVRYTVGTYSGLKAVNAADDEEAIRKVRAWARRECGLPMAAESYRVVVTHRKKGE